MEVSTNSNVNSAVYTDDVPPPYEDPPSYFEAVNGCQPVLGPAAVVAENTSDHRAPKSFSRRVKERIHDLAVFLVFVSTVLVLWTINDKTAEDRSTVLRTVGLNTLGIILTFISFRLPKKLTKNVEYIVFRGFEIAALLVSAFLVFASFLILKEFISSSDGDKKLTIAAFCHVSAFIIELGTMLVLMFTFDCTKFATHEGGNLHEIDAVQQCFLI